MPRNFIKTIFLSLFTITFLSAVGLNKSYQEDSLIMEGILADNEQHFDKSKEIFLRLYYLTNNSDYLIQASKEATMGNAHFDNMIPLLKKYIKNSNKSQKNYTKALRILITLYAQKGRLDLAEPLANRLINSKNPKDIKIVIAIKKNLREYKQALKLLKNLYEKSHSEDTLLEEVSILEKDLKKPQEAIRILQSHINFNPDASIGIYFKLIELYAKENRLEKVLELYTKLYKKDPQSYFLQKIIKLSIYLHEEERAISILEKNPTGNEELLYQFYTNAKRFKKAILLADKLFKKTKEPKWLAEEAILRYEVASKNKHITPKLLKRFCKLFDEALKGGVDDSFYLNYYGYILIEHNLDIKRGIKLVRKALKQRPEDSYYLDSLAWGLYKIGDCQKAYNIMEKIFTNKNIKEPEIKIHREKIQKCFKKEER